MAAPLTSSQSSLASQLLQKGIVICPFPCGSGLARDGSATGFKAELAGKPAPTEKQHRNLPAPTVGAGLPAMAAPLVSRQSSLASQLLQKGIVICPLLLWERACPRWQRRWFQGKARWQASSYRKAASQSAPSPCGSGLARDGGAADFRQSSLASQLLQKSSIAIRPSPCGSGLARDGSTAGFKAKLAGKPAPTEKHRNPPLPLWERACPRWRRCCLQGSSFR